jgi:DNA mismatch repair protein MutL
VTYEAQKRMGQIRKLSPALVNRIAAGECVERPASVVKELVENALDAGAGRIDVSIGDGGRGLIAVVDDGCGMDATDLALCVQPHATSKLSDDDDLFSIHTMGFRGEALPSIGAVSRLRVISRPHGCEVGHMIDVEAGEISSPQPCAAPPGTSVEVRDLFYCVPARRKFLRTNQTEVGHITEQFARLALAHPGVAFSLRHQDRLMHRLEATGDCRQRVGDFYGPELAGVLLPVQREGDGLRVSGYVVPPAHCRRSTKWEYVFVNGRYVRDRFASHAIKEAYRSLIKPDEYPVVFLFITIDPAHVDVNVHPTKIEVRWRDSNYVHAQILAALRERFLSTNLDRTLRPVTSPDEDDHRERVRQAMVDFFRKPVSAGGAPGVRPAARTGGGVLSAPGSESTVDGGWRDTQGFGQELTEISGVERAQELRPSAEPHGDGGTSDISSESVGPLARGAAPMRAIQVHNTYLVVETEDGLTIIDQHALHERILYEELRRRMVERPLESQRLLLPVLVSVPADRIEVLETHSDTLSRLGIDLAPAGPQTVALHAFPTLLERIEPSEFVRDLLDLLSEQGHRPNLESLVHDVLDMMACKAAVKAGDPLTPEEIAALLARREPCERSSHCPHGRPSALRLSLRDLERQFKRR